jgi:hypothetical protein
MITGSALNDGVYTYHDTGINNDDDSAAAGLRDETFAGTISALSVPPSLIALSGEISEWVAKYADVVNSPYQSESFGGYSYSKGNSASGTGAYGWQDQFSARLNPYRRLSVL